MKLLLRPAPATRKGETHSSLVESEFLLGAEWDVSVFVRVDEQLRTQWGGKKRGMLKKPNPWEVAWIFGDALPDGSAALYFAFKTNGIELGAFRFHGEEVQFLATLPEPKLQIGRWYEYRLVKRSGLLSAYVDNMDTPVAEASLAPVAHWTFGDRLGLYCEDSAVRFGTVRIDEILSPPPPSPGDITLTATGYMVKRQKKVDLAWSGATSANVDIYRNGGNTGTTENDGLFTDHIAKKGGGTYTYKVCETGTSFCSNGSAVTF